METTLEGENAREFLNLRLPIPLALARLLLLTNGVSSVESMEQSTMLMWNNEKQRRNTHFATF